MADIFHVDHIFTRHGIHPWKDQVISTGNHIGETNFAHGKVVNQVASTGQWPLAANTRHKFSD